LHQCYLSEALVERVVLLLSYLIKMTRITPITIATTTPPMHPAIASMLLVWDSGGENCTATILPDKDDKDHYHHYRHYYTTNTSCYRINVTILPDKDDKDHNHHYRHYYTTNTSWYRINVTCLRLWWRLLYNYYLTW
jgi:hypothetical protein